MRALRAEAAGRRRAVLEACRRGLDVLDEHRLTLGAAELRARTTARGAELASLAQRACAGAGSPRRLLVWSERWRATVTVAVSADELGRFAVEPFDDGPFSLRCRLAPGRTVVTDWFSGRRA